MPGEVDRLVADALHQAAVAGEHISEMIDEFVAETRRLEALCYRHADGGGEALAERPGGRLDARRVAIFGMARGFRAELAELLQILDVDAGIADEIAERVEQHRAVSGGEHEAVAVRPMGIGGVEFQKASEQHAGHIGHAHRHAGVAGLGLFDRVHRQRANGVGVLLAVLH